MLTLLSCVLQNPALTLEAVHSRGANQLTTFLAEFLDTNAALGQASGSCNHKQLRSAYELKLFSVALTNVVFMSTEQNQSD